uniref:Tripartite motif containing 35-30 n=1 Tax=Salarias fasciatus TaxID=181472 RepID=A0A672F6F5_SALFA
MANTEPWVGPWRPHRPRRPIAAMHQTPGPNKYLLPSLTGTSKHDPTKSKSPAFSMASRHLQSTVHHSPGPAHFVEPNTTRTGRHTAPGVSLKGKRQSQVKFAGPGPVFHFAGPADYRVKPVPKPVNPKASSTFGHRPTAGGFYESTGQTPGPAAYGAVKLDKWKRKAPEYTMAGRPSARQQNVTTPGPAAHRPGPVRNLFTAFFTPSFSFGVHHSQYKTPLILNDDY